MLGSLVSSSFGSSSPEEAGDRGVSKDLFAAEILQSEADEGNPFARELIRDSRTFLGAASIHSARASRVRKGAMKASRLGYHGLARMGMDAARSEEGQATTYAAQVTSLVRRSHAGVFGYITPEEERQQRRNLYLESLSAEQREGVMNQLLDRVMQTSVNYGVDHPAAEEVDDHALSEIYAAVQCYGADLDVVFGAGAFKKVGETIRPAITKLQKRMKAVEKRLRAVESGLNMPSPAEDEEPAEEKAKGKRARVKKKLDEAEEVSEATEEAEQKSDEMGAVEAAALFDDPKAEIYGVDQALMFAVDLFGLSEKRGEKVEARIEKLEQKLAALEEQDGSEKKIAALKRRIVKLRSKLDSAPEGKASEDSLPDALVTKQPKAYSQDEFVSSFFGDAGTPRRAFVGFFTRRAEAMGVDVPQMHSAFGAVESDDTRRSLVEFFEDVGQRAQTMFNPQMRAALKSARDEARKSFSVDEKRATLRAARRDYRDAAERSRDYVRQVGRSLRGRGDAPALPLKATPGDYLNMPGGYAYRLDESGSITILKTPRKGKGRVIPAGTAMNKKILAEILKYSENRAGAAAPKDGNVAPAGLVPGTYENMPGGYTYNLDESGTLTVEAGPKVNEKGRSFTVSTSSAAGTAILKQISENPDKNTTAATA